MLRYALSISIHTTTQVVTLVIEKKTDSPDISIHTTTQVVTKHYTKDQRRIYISIHTTTQVVTDRAKTILTAEKFQSTPPRRW